MGFADGLGDGLEDGFTEGLGEGAFDTVGFEVGDILLVGEGVGLFVGDLLGFAESEDDDFDFD